VPASAAPGLTECPSCKSKDINNNVCGDCGCDIVDFVKQAKEAERNKARSHLETELNDCVAVVCDIGKTHTRNDDNGIVADEELGGVKTQIVVVCDGVSNSQKPDVASEAACKVALEQIRAQLAAGADPKQALDVAIRAANQAVIATEFDPTLTNALGKVIDSAAATFVGLIVRNGVATYCWAGDSRAYAITKGEKGYVAERLTVDQSWLTEALKRGVSFEEANNNALAHAIEEYLGDPDIEPAFGECSAADKVLFFACTDGYWNLPDADDSKPPQAVADAVFAVGEGASALTIARALVNNANSFDGHDNVTVGVVKKRS
jgi:serine/threonine protein phosphatase PrpC/ribosomal protein L32